jgi:hypothetical protein
MKDVGELFFFKSFLIYIYKRNGSVTLAIHLSYTQFYVVPIFNFFFPLKNSENTFGNECYVGYIGCKRSV